MDFFGRQSRLSRVTTYDTARLLGCDSPGEPLDLVGRGEIVIEEVFDQAALMKYPKDKPCACLGFDFKVELYAAFGRAIEAGELANSTLEDIVCEVATTLLAGPGGVDWNRDAARSKISDYIKQLAFI